MWFRCPKGKYTANFILAENQNHSEIKKIFLENH